MSYSYRARSGLLRPSYTMRESARHGLLEEVKMHYERDAATIYERDDVSVSMFVIFFHNNKDIYNATPFPKWCSRSRLLPVLLVYLTLWSICAHRVDGVCSVHKSLKNTSYEIDPNSTALSPHKTLDTFACRTEKRLCTWLQRTAKVT